MTQKRTARTMLADLLSALVLTFVLGALLGWIVALAFGVEVAGVVLVGLFLLLFVGFVVSEP